MWVRSTARGRVCWKQMKENRPQVTCFCFPKEELNCLSGDLFQVNYIDSSDAFLRWLLSPWFKKTGPRGLSSRKLGTQRSWCPEIRASDLPAVESVEPPAARVLLACGIHRWRPASPKRTSPWRPGVQRPFGDGQSPSWLKITSGHFTPSKQNLWFHVFSYLPLSFHPCQAS